MDPLDHIADAIVEEQHAGPARVFSGRGDVEVEVEIPNTGWGLPSGVHDRIRELDAKIDDFSHIDPHNGTIRIYLVPE